MEETGGSQSNIDELGMVSPELEVIKLQKESAFKWRERRHDDWTTNYTLYRDKVIYNRLTQRQSVNIPLMKQAIKTILKDIDDAPLLIFENLDNNQQKGILYNEYWQDTAEKNKLVIKDIVDKRQVLLYGRSFKKLNIVNGRFYFEIVDPQDILVNRYVDPADMDTARNIHHIHIFRPLSSLRLNTEYDQESVTRLMEFYATEQGLIKSEENARSLQDRNDRMSQLGVEDIDNPTLGETYVEINENYVKEYDEKLKKDVIWLTVTVDDREILLKKRLDEVIGKTSDDFWQDHYPFVTWGDEVDRTDFWSDGPADVVRPGNLVVNSWYSQEVENRTLANYGMNYYNASTPNFTPQTFEPRPWGWYPIPGNPNELIQKIDIKPLQGNLEAMNFVIQLIEKATASPATAAGAPTEKQITLGEIQLSLAEAKERVQSMSKFYDESWKEFGLKFIKMVEAAYDKLDSIKVYKKGFRGNMFSKEIKPKDWDSKSGYQVRILSKSEKEVKDTQDLQKLNAVRASLPDNQPLLEIYQKHLLDFAGLTPDEQQEVLNFEKQKLERMNSMGAGTGIVPTGQPTETTPAQPNNELIPMIQ